MSAQTVSRIVDPAVEEDFDWGETAFVDPSARNVSTREAAAEEPADEFDPFPVRLDKSAQPPAAPLRPEEVEALIGDPVGDMIAQVEHAISGQPASATVDIEAEDHAASRPVASDPVVATSGEATGEHSLPRIGIDVFALQSSTQQAAERAAADRRFKRATTTVRPGGAAGAMEHYAGQGTPALVIVESDKAGGELLAELDRLAEYCDAGTKVVVVGRYNDIALYRELMRRGVSEYLVAPLDTLNLIRTVTGLFTDPDAPFVGRTVAFVGAKGGVGASALAHNVGYAISERVGTPAVIVDYDLPFGTAGLDFNQDPLQGVADALSQPDRLDATLLERMMVRCTDKLSLFAAPATLDSTYEIDAEAFEEVSAKIRGTAPFVIMDLPHIWSNWMRQTLLSADDVVIVATPDLASLRNAKNLFDLIRQARPNDAPPRLVLNQVGVPGRPEIPVKDFANALGVEPSLVLPFDPKTFGQAANNGQMVLEGGGKTKTAEGLIHLAQMISRREAPAKPAAKSILSGLLKKKSA
jgi:pilus assembly protein CpaE